MQNFTQAALDASASGSVGSDSHGVDIDTTPLPPGIATTGKHSIGVVSSEGRDDAMNNDNDQPSLREIAVANEGDHVAQNEENEDCNYGTIREDETLGLQSDVEADRGESASDDPEPPTQEILPGAYPFATDNPNNDEVDASTEPSEPVNIARGSEIIDEESQDVVDAQNLMIKAYKVEQQQALEEAKVVPTIWGIDKKRFYQICVLVVAALTIIIGVFISVLLPRNNLDSENAAPLPLLTGEERAQRRAILVNTLSPLNEGRVFDTDSPSSSADRIAALEWLIDDIPSNISNTPEGLFDYYFEWKMIQRYIMAVLYFSTNGPGWIDSNFMTSKGECEWHSAENEVPLFFDHGVLGKKGTNSTFEIGAYCKGVYCNKSLKIKRIDLVSNNAVGTIPPEISFLHESMRSITLGQNAISSTIPSSLGKLSNLWLLDLSHNCLSGNIPKDIIHLPFLLKLKLMGNPLLTGNLNGVCNGTEHKLSTNKTKKIVHYIGVDCVGCMASESFVECDCCGCFDINTFSPCSRLSSAEDRKIVHYAREACTSAS